jgi:S-DNA-T family DNA segregation ATPase FtsK/SpoIIIE
MMARRRPWLLYAGAAAAVLPVLIALRHVPGPVWAAAAAVIGTLARVYLVASGHVWDVLGIAALVLAARVTWAAVRFARLPRAAKRHYPAACWHRLRWRWLARNLDLSYADKHRRSIRPVAFGTAAPQPAALPPRPRLRFPRAHFQATVHGIVASVRPIPNVGRAEIEAASQSIADVWKCQRVSVSQPRPGILTVRGLKHDPLLEHLGLEDAPAGTYSGQDLTRLYVGRDESGEHRHMQVKDNTAATVAGQPGSGKSVGINGLLLQWAPSPACQFGTADGKSPVDGGDYEVWRPRAWRTCSDSREDTADMLSDACAVMRERLGQVAGLTGSRNAWHRGPTEDFPLFGIVLDEAQRYLDVSIARRDKDLERLILQIQQMAGDLVRQGRSVLMFLILATQRATVDSIPGQIRDNAALSLALSQKTADGCVAALGSQIRDYPSFLPTTLQGPEYTGCAVATMRTGQDPYTRLKLPEVTEADLEAAAAATAHLRRDPRLLMPVAVPDDARVLGGIPS